MRAWQTTKAGRPRDVLQLQEQAPSPEPYPGSIRVQVAAAGIGLPDAFMCDGSYPMTPQVFPFTQGQEVTGRIVAVGEGVSNRNVGDRVMAVTSFFTGQGSFAEECLALDDFCLPVPDAMSDAEAAGFLIPFHTAYIGLVTRGQLASHETLLVLGGAGGTGQAAIQVGKAIGARVIATASGPERADFCLDLGADQVIDHRKEDIAKAVRAATDGRGVDVVYDPVGGEAFTAATHCVAPEGRVLAIGFASGAWGKVDTGHAVFNNYSVVGVIPTHYDRDFKERTQEQLLEWWAAGKLRSRVEERVPFEALPEALESLVGRSAKGKLVLVVDPDGTS